MVKEASIKCLDAVLYSKGINSDGQIDASAIEEAKHAQSLSAQYRNTRIKGVQVHCDCRACAAQTRATGEEGRRQEARCMADGRRAGDN